MPEAAPHLRFDGRVAAITGAGRGIGRAHALLLAERGAAVVVNDLGGATGGGGASREPAAAVVDEIRAAGGAACASFDDIATPDGAARLVDLALERFGRIDVVVNNAGITQHAPLTEITPESFDRMMRVHAYGHFHVTRAAWPHLLDQRYGRVVNTTSGGGLYGMDELAHYATAKAAILGLTRALALEGREHGVNVNAVAPAAVTRMILEAGRSAAVSEAQMSAEQVAPMVAWLAHESCTVSGEIYTVGAGRAARVFVAEGRGAWTAEPTVEWARDHQAEIDAEDAYTVPSDALDNGAWIMRNAGAPAATGT